MTPNSKDSETKTNIYPQFEHLSFLSFLQKIGMGMIFSFIPAVIYIMILGVEVELFKVWGITLLMTSGIYFLIGGCSDLSQSSARKSFKRYSETVEKTGQREGGYKYDIGLTQFGKNWENFAAGICLFTISLLISGLTS